VAITMEQLAARLSKVERKQQQQERIIAEFTARFAWYYFDDRKKAFALIEKLDPKDKRKADLIVLSSYVSGDCEVMRGKELVNPNSDFPKEGRWEPMVPPQEVLDLLGLSDAKPDERTDAFTD
jgi:hypothetical protein